MRKAAASSVLGHVLEVEPARDTGQQVALDLVHLSALPNIRPG
jgi:hypothetical protein